MSKSDWVGYTINYIVAAYFLWCAYGNTLDRQVFFFMLILVVVIRAEAKRIRVELAASRG